MNPTLSRPEFGPSRRGEAWVELEAASASPSAAGGRRGDGGDGAASAWRLQKGASRC